MHQYQINASIQLVPLAQQPVAYKWIDDVIEIIQSSKLQYTVGAFNTTIEGKYTDVMQLIDAVNNFLYEKACNEWILNVQIQIRSNGDVTEDEKVGKWHN